MAPHSYAEPVAFCILEVALPVFPVSVHKLQSAPLSQQTCPRPTEELANDLVRELHAETHNALLVFGSPRQVNKYFKVAQLAILVR